MTSGTRRRWHQHNIAETFLPTLPHLDCLTRPDRAIGGLRGRPAWLLPDGAPITLPWAVSTQPEYVAGLNSLVGQMFDTSVPAVIRIAATNIARTYLEAVTRSLVEEAREEGATWLEIADVFATSERNVKSRFADLRDYEET